MPSKGGSNRAFYRWLTRDYRACSPASRAHPSLSPLHDPSRLDAAFLAAPTVLGVIDTYGIELIHPMRGGPQSPARLAAKASPIIAGSSGAHCVCCSINGAWWSRGPCATANVADNTFQGLIPAV